MVVNYEKKIDITKKEEETAEERGMKKKLLRNEEWRTGE